MILVPGLLGPSLIIFSNPSQKKQHLQKQNMAASEPSCRAKRWSLKGMTALITGGTRGIGLVTVPSLPPSLSLDFYFFLIVMCVSFSIQICHRRRTSRTGCNCAYMFSQPNRTQWALARMGGKGIQSEWFSLRPDI